MSDIYQRKRDHIALCDTGEVHPGVHHGLFDDLTLVHDALPELTMDDLELTTTLLDHTLAAPFMVTGMTGGPPEAGDINRGVAGVCEQMGVAFGVGSQRIMTKADVTTSTFEVRSVAPSVVLFGNIGVNQARDLGPAVVADLMDRIGADYMAIHLNPGMELIQPGADADRDFTRGYDTIGRLVEALDGRVLVKECGTGLSPRLVSRLKQLGVRAVDVSGTGGTSWIKVEALRAQEAEASLGHLFANWGLPTAAATALAARVPGVDVVASGGIRHGLDAGKALALGAQVVGCARPILQAFMSEGAEGCQKAIETLVRGLRMVMALTAARTPKDLVTVPRVVGPQLGAWLQQLTHEEARK